MFDAVPLVLGLGRQDLIANAGIAGGIVMGLAVLAMIVVSVLPAFSESWAERLGTTETTPAGPDPGEVIPGREEPLAAPSAGGAGTQDPASNADDESTAIPEPETVGADEGDEGDQGKEGDDAA